MRGSHRNTTLFSVANLMFYAITNIAGHIYVNACNMNCSRASLFHSSYPSRRDFITTLLLIVPYFLLGNIVTLKAPHDTASSLSADDCLRNNMGTWFLGHFIGLQYTHFNQGFLKDFNFAPEKMKLWGAKLWAIAFLVMATYFGTTLFTLYMCFYLDMAAF